MRHRPYTHGNSYWLRHNACGCDLCEDAMERSRARQLRLPADPLIRHAPVFIHVGGNYGSMGGIRTVLTPNQQREFFRGKKQGWYSLWKADELACALGLHPAMVWGDEFFGWDE